ncbi:hypothetical protein [Catellatospora vulcania]|uniref:hypothetical protein n=1 Tax=Catellatospora vulcania TaxID=1460450 RepID=UPI0012D3D518|nr:hypothetical protein [Catellatospora vulcania]
MVDGAYRDFLAALAGTTGALTGLLFVAISVARINTSKHRLTRQVRAGAALIAFTNALAVSLFALVPGTNIGYPAIVAGAVGLLFVAAAVRSMLTDRPNLWQGIRQLALMLLLLLIFGIELVCGYAVLRAPGDGTPLDLIGYALVTLVIIGIARSWELVGGRDTGPLASAAIIVGGRPPPLPEDRADN